MKSVIFDFDGVLANTLDPIVDFLSRISFRSKDRVREEVLELLMVNDKENFFQRYIKDMLAKPLENFLIKQPNLLFVDKLDQIEELPTAKAILSNNYSFICKKLLGNYVDMFEIIIGDDIADTKVEGFELIFLNPKFSREHTIFVTDSVGDVLEAQKVLPKKNIFAVDWGYHSRATLSKVVSKTHMLSDFSTLEKLLYEHKTSLNTPAISQAQLW